MVFGLKDTVHDNLLNGTRMTRIQRMVADLVSNKSASIRPIRVIRVLFQPLSIICRVLNQNT